MTRRADGIHARLGGTIRRARSAWLATTDRRCAIGIPGLCTGHADTVDDIVPLSRAATPDEAKALAADPANWRPACRACNSSRGSRMRHSQPRSTPSRAW